MSPFKILIASLALTAPLSHAASFDCAKAALPMEKMICTDPALSQLDSELGAAYTRAIARLKDKNLLRQWQRTWLRSPDLTACTSAACARPMYKARVDLLDAAVASPWNGHYQRYFNGKPDRHASEIVLVALKSGSVNVQGDTLWMGPNAANGQVHVGEIDGSASLTGESLMYEDAECNVNFQRQAGGLKVEDSNTCGGHNATFTGTYRRKR